MKRRTIVLGGAFTKHVGLILGFAVAVVAVAEGLNAVCCLLASERED